MLLLSYFATLDMCCDLAPSHEIQWSPRSGEGKHPPASHFFGVTTRTKLAVLPRSPQPDESEGGRRMNLLSRYHQHHHLDVTNKNDVGVVFLLVFGLFANLTIPGLRLAPVQLMASTHRAGRVPQRFRNHGRGVHV